ncbi:MAG: glycine dehydrogenase (aminomethyl-transferring) [Candidatus Schekmanbacteria bacterium RBG_16_38_10]|uniref:Probable glycine dehydrogenase (decarboxylating) subunit 1 n=1 Tax=Candidatus Schekmanbacteria bacterium RBG_16_38_10 TaxID=1817879 RepID=A0A1F7RRQ6_9BACT|nr:MAG: glycine dehydrogenase (aminomethyl-transferring) [Candidatus Schekmanbacteria bacterium RBG_16_38_10]
MNYTPHTEDDVKAMLSAIQVETVNKLFLPIPENLQLKRRLNLPVPLSEHELINLTQSLGMKNANYNRQDMLKFIGGGSYSHLIPSIVDVLSSRGEFATAYTPYQAEASQGTLQAIFEYQTMVCELTGMDVSNASHYDGAVALVEAIAVAISQTDKNLVLLSAALNPDYKRVIRTYLQNINIEIVELPYDEGSGQTTFSGETSRYAKDASCIVVQSPNYFGVIEDMDAVAEFSHRNGMLAISSSNPTTLAILKSPGEAGFDIATGDGQPFGIEPFLGGPTIGFIATKKELIRSVPGRIVGETVDADGKRAFVLTLQTREQHIRREKASSNICTNQSLLALRTAIYLSALGKEGFREVAEQCLLKTHYLKQRLIGKGINVKFTAPFFNELVVEFSNTSAEEIVSELLRNENILAGIALGKDYPSLANSLLITITEKVTKNEIDRLVDVLASAS